MTRPLAWTSLFDASSKVKREGSRTFESERLRKWWSGREWVRSSAPREETFIRAARSPPKRATEIHGTSSLANRGSCDVPASR